MVSTTGVEGIRREAAREAVVVPIDIRARRERAATVRAPAPPGRLRLTRRGRVVFTVLGLLLAFGIVRGGTAVAEGPSEPRVVDVHIVAAGDTVWGLARRVARDGEDVRDVVAEVLRLNRLDSADLRVGQRILLPSDEP